MNHLTFMKSGGSWLAAGTFALMLGAFACTDTSHVSTDASANKTDATPPPPSFLDPEPTPPTSDTIVLSGGNLVLEETTQDTAIVLKNGVLLAWGKRGEVDMPNDSIGKDMRGKWVTPGTLTDLAHKTVPNLSALKIGEPANMLVFKTDPSMPGLADEDLHGIVVDGELQIFATDEDS